VGSRACGEEREGAVGEETDGRDGEWWKGRESEEEWMRMIGGWLTWRGARDRTDGPGQRLPSPVKPRTGGGRYVYAGAGTAPHPLYLYFVTTRRDVRILGSCQCSVFLLLFNSPNKFQHTTSV